MVRVARQGLLRSPMLEVVAPEALDDHVGSDGIVERAGVVPAGAAGRVAEQIIRRAPLSLWENEFRRSPADLVACLVVGDFAGERTPDGGPRRGRRGTARGHGRSSTSATPQSTLPRQRPPPGRAGDVRAASTRPWTRATARSCRCSARRGPWPADLGTAVVGYVERLIATGLRESRPLLQLVGRRLPVRTPFTVETLQARATAEDWADQQARSAGSTTPGEALSPLCPRPCRCALASTTSPKEYPVTEPLATAPAESELLRPHAEQLFADEPAALAAADDRPRPPSWPCRRP